MPQAQVASSHYEPDGPGDSPKYLINAYPEENGADPNRPVKLVVRPGSLDRDTGDVLAANTIRGIAQTDGHASGHVLVVNGGTVRSYDPTGVSWSTLTGSLAGTDRVQAAFSESEGAFLSGGDIYVSTGSAVAAATDADWATLRADHGETDFTSITSLSQRLIATYGSRFGYSASLDFNNTTTLNFYTAESSPDGLVAAVTLGASLYLFGTETIERWVQTGDNDNPFRPQTSAVIQRGALARDTIKLLDNTLFFVADDYTVRRIAGQVAQIVSEPWVVRELRKETPSDLIASVMEYENHSFYILNGLNVCAVYDVATGSWALWKTYGSETFEYPYIVEASGDLFAASRSTSRFVELSRSYASDYQPYAGTYSTPIVWEHTAHLPVMGGRKPIASIRHEGTTGLGSAANNAADNIVSMRLSKDGGRNWGPWRDRSAGKIGEYDKRLIWNQNGRAREPQIIAHFRGNDNRQTTGVMVGEDR
ncbi:MAG: packaged DNA stabilization protein [Pseudomonadota bacterium]